MHFSITPSNYYLLSPEATAQVTTWQKSYQQKIDRKSWHNYFMTIAYDVASRSLDARTANGAVIVSQSNEMVSSGYNSFMREVDNSVLPNVAPEKYTWMLHAEINAILACARHGRSTLDTKIYVTGMPCVQCLQFIWQSGIKEIVYDSSRNIHMNNNEQTRINHEIIMWLTHRTKHPLKLTSINFKLTKENTDATL